MTAAYRLKGLGWFAGGVVVTLAFYLVSLQVAAERKKLEQMNGRIASTERDIRALETEFDTRANLAQLERWNGDILALSAPTAGQFMRDEAQLAAVDFHHPLGAGGPEVKTAALVVPSYAVPTLRSVAQQATPGAAPAVVPAAPTVSTPAPVIAVAAAPRSVDRPLIVRAAYDPALANVARPQLIRATTVTIKPRQVAMLDRPLLSAGTLGELTSGAKNEAGKHR